MPDNVTPTLVVSTQAELNSAVKSLTEGSGGTILLKAGPAYSLIANDWRDSQTDAAITIRSEDIDNPAELRQVKLVGRENITIEHTKMYATKEQIGNESLLFISDSENITLRNNEMSSNAKGIWGDQTADVTLGVNLASVRNSDTVSFEGNTISNFLQGLALRDTYNTSFVDNDVTQMQGDGIRVGGADGLHIEGNHFHDFIGSTYVKNHPDIIQFWGTNIKVNNQNVTIRENVIDMAGTIGYQLIFGRNEHKSQNGWDFDNFLIEHNVLIGAHTHMISISEISNSVVRNNTTLYDSSAFFVSGDGTRETSTMTGTIRLGGENNVIENNIGHSIHSGLDNAVLSIGDDRNANDYSNHFVNVEAGKLGDLRDFSLRPDSEFNGVMGSRLTWATTESDTFKAIATVTRSTEDLSVVTLSAELSQTAGIEDVTYYWLFDDGTHKTGEVIEHDFGTEGIRGFTLYAKHDSETYDTITRKVEIKSPVTATIDANDDHIDFGGRAEDKITVTSAVTAEEGWMEIGGRQRISIDRSEDALFNRNSFNYEMTLDVDPGAEGYFLHQHRSLGGQVDKHGYVIFRLDTDAGAFTLKSDKPVFDKDGAHHINIVYDGAKGTLTLYVDGEAAASMAAAGQTAAREFWGLHIGHNFGEGVEARVQNIKLNAEAASAEEVAARFESLLDNQMNELIEATKQHVFEAEQQAAAEAAAPADVDADVDGESVAPAPVEEAPVKDVAVEETPVATADAEETQDIAAPAPEETPEEVTEEVTEEEAPEEMSEDTRTPVAEDIPALQPELPAEAEAPQAEAEIFLNQDEEAGNNGPNAYFVAGRDPELNELAQLIGSAWEADLIDALDAGVGSAGTMEDLSYI